MAIRNELLKSIVIASGGAVTGSTINGLLQDWLDAVDPPVSYVARIDGLTQAWQFSEPLNLQVGDEVYLSYTDIATDGSRSYFFGDESFQFALFTTPDGVNFDSFGLSSTVNGQAIAPESTLVPLTGFNDLVITLARGASPSFIGTRVSSSGYKMNGALFNFSVVRGGEVIHEIPLTDKSQGATQLPTVGSVSVTMINYTEAVWQEL